MNYAKKHPSHYVTITWSTDSESKIWACEFHTDPNKDSAEIIIKQVENKTLFETGIDMEKERQLTYTAFAETLYFKEKFSPSKISDFIDSIAVLKGSELEKEVKEL